MTHIGLGLLCAAILVAKTSVAAASAQPTASTSPAASAVATESPAATPSASPSPQPTRSPIVPPRDAPAVRSTTPPIGPTQAPSIPPLPDSLWLDGDTAINVPITIHGQRPYIQVVLNGHPATFVIDTGATATIVDPAAAQDGPAQNAISLQIGDLRFPRLQPVLANVRSYTETCLGMPADGVLGRDLLARYPVSLDFPDRTLTIFRESRSAAAAQPAAAVSMALRVIDGQPAVLASLDGQPVLWFALGTGTSFEVQVRPATGHASRYARAEHSLPLLETTISGDVTGLLVRAHSLSVGPLMFNQPLLALLDLQRDHAKTELAGALGATMLNRLNLMIDEVIGNVEVTAPPGAELAPLYNTSGITLMMKRGDIVIRSVVPGTPADVAHLRAGDEIVSVDGLVPATLDFARQLLDGSPGTKVVVAYRRWHITHSVTLALHVII